MKKALVLGAGGFIGSHLVNRLKQENYFVIGVDLKYPEYCETKADLFYISDLRIYKNVQQILESAIFDEIYQLAADMGGAGYVFSGNHDADIISNSVQINLNVAQCISKLKKVKLFFSSSACIYPELESPICKEEIAYPAHPENEYGWEKLFSERLYSAYHKNYEIDVRIARFHNIFGEYSSIGGEREKSIIALCRKVIEANEYIEVWGDGNQTRSYLYVGECVEGICRFINADKAFAPTNLGSDLMISINDLAKMIIDISGKNLYIKNVDGIVGVNGRNSDNTSIKQNLNWVPNNDLQIGLEKTYNWVKEWISKKQ